MFTNNTLFKNNKNTEFIKHFVTSLRGRTIKFISLNLNKPDKTTQLVLYSTLTYRDNTNWYIVSKYYSVFSLSYSFQQVSIIWKADTLKIKILF